MSAPQSPAADDIQTLFRYTRWANARMLDAMQAAGAVPARAVELLSHLLRVQDVWFGRVEGTAHADLVLWVDEDLAACAERAGTSIARWQSMLEERSGDALDQPVAYTNSTGTRLETPLRDRCRHVVNHGTHHRAQIALVLREADGAPPPTDVIFFVRDA
ncbi:DinB family protein [Salinibacter ruber]|uniref:DinB family protein n=1 Tax=Salinibacter ruber TaxID=146919 RepID=UPI000E6D17D1|nr:DinB family protein [Salinibacter ruber]